MELTINSDKSLSEAIQELTRAYTEHRFLRVTVKTGKQRTLTQNRALHLYLTMVSDALNDAGIEQTVFFKPGFVVPWNPQTAKDCLWRPIQQAVTGQESTTKPETGQYSLIYDALNRKLAEHGIHVPWPEREQE